uniref:PITH domain-containing protein n=1 Tax=Heterorhabditis bacteriophora TaxID=37862 RepID=A0A1I7X7W8_HETBA
MSHCVYRQQLFDDTFVYFVPCFANDRLKVLGGFKLTVIGINPVDENSPKTSPSDLRSGELDGQPIMVT